MGSTWKGTDGERGLVTYSDTLHLIDGINGIMNVLWIRSCDSIINLKGLLLDPDFRFAQNFVISFKICMS